MSYINNYVINNKTLAILPYNKNSSIVYEVDRFFVVQRRPNYIIKSNCILNGCPLESRLEVTKKLTNYTYKSPILIKEEGMLIFFPTSSPRLSSVEWICLNRINRFFDNPIKNTTSIIFDNGKLLEFKVSYNIISSQILRATHLDSKLRKIMFKNA